MSTENLETLTQEEKKEITREVLNKFPTESVGMVALLKLGELAVSTNAGEIIISSEATFEKKRFKLKMVVTTEEIKSTSKKKS